MEKHEIKKDEAVKENCYTMPDSVSGSSAYTYMAELFAVPSVLKRIYTRTGVEVFYFCSGDVQKKEFVAKISSGENSFKAAVRECEVLHALQGKEYVVKVLESHIFSDSKQVILLEEPLYPLQRSEWRKPHDIFKLGIKLCEIFMDLRSEKIAYHDICIKNIMFRNNSMLPVLSDFNCITRERIDDPPISVVGTPPYIAPEIMHHLQYNEAAEVYALGVLISKLLMEKDSDYYFPYDDVPTIIPDFFVGNIECQSCERSEMDTFFEKYPSLGNAVNMDSQKRYRTFQEFKEAMLLNELRTY